MSTVAGPSSEQVLAEVLVSAHASTAFENEMNSEGEPFEMAREWCRMVCNQCGSANGIDPLKLFWVAQTRAQFGLPQSTDISAEHMGKNKPLPMSSILDLNFYQLKFLRQQLPQVEILVTKLRAFAEEQESPAAATLMDELMESLLSVRLQLFPIEQP